MAEIRYVNGTVLYENPRPHVRSRHAYFPGLVKLPSGDLLATLMIAEAFESADGTTYLARSKDAGKTWALEGTLYDKTALDTPSTRRPPIPNVEIGDPESRQLVDRCGDGEARPDVA